MSVQLSIETNFTESVLSKYHLLELLEWERVFSLMETVKHVQLDLSTLSVQFHLCFRVQKNTKKEFFISLDVPKRCSGLTPPLLALGANRDVRKV